MYLLGKMLRLAISSVEGLAASADSDSASLMTGVGVVISVGIGVGVTVGAFDSELQADTSNASQISVRKASGFKIFFCFILAIPCVPLASIVPL